MVSYNALNGPNVQVACSAVSEHVKGVKQLSNWVYNSLRAKVGGTNDEQIMLIISNFIETFSTS